MDKVRLIVTETFRSETEAARKENLQLTVDQYIRLILQSSGPIPGEETEVGGEQE